MKRNYSQFLQRFQNWLNDVNEHEFKSLNQGFFEFQTGLIEIGQYTKQQIRDYTYYIKRDLDDFKANWYKQNQDELSGAEFNEQWWLALSYLVDKTQLEWALLLEDIEHDGIYKQGEWVAFGDFHCQRCGYSLYINHPTQLDSCLECQHTQFIRIPYAP
jgi:hypothetical protein